MIAVIDYGVGNLFSLKSSFAAIGQEAVVTADEVVLRQADRIILLGVGAFGDAVKKLRESGLFDLVIALAKEGKPIMGICLGMQMLFDKSFEYGEHQGLGLIHGAIRPIAEVIPAELKIPHIGWNALDFTRKDSRLLRYVREGEFVYFVHSYYGADCHADTVATAEYGAPLTAVVERGNVCGCQFHPEKSGDVGLRILRAFCED